MRYGEEFHMNANSKYVYTLQKLITTKGPCQRPDLMTKKQLNDELQSRGLSFDDSLKQRQSTLETDDRSMNKDYVENSRYILFSLSKGCIYQY